jgi:hypothetical protein
MKKYSFLLKPIFFIFNLVFATWLVLAIEKIQPSDLGEYKSAFVNEKPLLNKNALLKIISAYKTGAIDSLQLEIQLNHLLSGKK